MERGRGRVWVLDCLQVMESGCGREVLEGGVLALFQTAVFGGGRGIVVSRGALVSVEIVGSGPGVVPPVERGDMAKESQNGKMAMKVK